MFIKLYPINIVELIIFYLQLDIIYDTMTILN